ncbi:MAG TPA: hypothetical protein VD884_12495 [Ohtaekwangia sp.]|nr:hypothetical protein [Ohtaekwangia sp.]
MDTVRIKESELRQITLFIIDTKIIFHPVISPNGFPDFSNHQGIKNILILDRNILTPMIGLLKTGHLKDDHIRKIIGSLMVWTQFNNISVTSGLALSEYAYHKGREAEANLERDLFLKAFNNYHPNIWLEIALGRRKTIEPLTVDASEEFSYNKEYDHYKMHYLEMLKIAQYYFDQSLSLEGKITRFHRWVYDNLILCGYTISYLALLTGGRINTFNKTKNFDQVISQCKNQAWDLSYLSLWSTLYDNEPESNANYLFATLDKGLKQIFMLTHNEAIDLHSEIFGSNVGGRINQSMHDIFKPRPLPKMSIEHIDEMIGTEFSQLEQTYNSTTRQEI